MNEIPRRIKMECWTPAEKKIQECVDLVETMGASLELTAAVTALGKAREHVANHVDAQEKKDSPAP